MQITSPSLSKKIDIVHIRFARLANASQGTYTPSFPGEHVFEVRFVLKQNESGQNQWFSRHAKENRYIVETVDGATVSVLEAPQTVTATFSR